MEEDEVIICRPDLIAVFSRQHDLDSVLQHAYISLHAFNEVSIDNNSSLHLQEAVIQLLLNIGKPHVDRQFSALAQEDLHLVIVAADISNIFQVDHLRSLPGL